MAAQAAAGDCAIVAAMNGHDSHEEEILGKAYDARLMRRLLAYVRPYRLMTAGAVALILASSALQLVGPLATAVALDLFVRPPQARAAQLSNVSLMVRHQLVAHGVDPAHVQASGLTVVAVVYIAALLLTFLTIYAEGYVMMLIGQYIMYDLRNQIFGHLQRLPLAFFDRNPIGRLVTRVTTDVDALNEMFTSGLVELLGDVLLLAGIVVVLFWLDWRLALVAFSIVPLLALLTAWFRGGVRQAFREVRVKIAAINAFLQEHITGMPVVQLFGREARAYGEFVEINDRHRVANVRSIFYYAVYFPGVELITALGIGPAGLGGWRPGAGRSRVARRADRLPAVRAALLPAALGPVREVQHPAGGHGQLGAHLPAARHAGRASRRRREPTRPPRVRGAIEFDQRALQLPAGRAGAQGRLVPGAAGRDAGGGRPHRARARARSPTCCCASTTLDSGAVRVDGVDVREWALPVLRRGIGMVLQDVFLFAGTIAENIHLGDAAIDDARLRWAAGEVHALPFIERLPGGMQAPVRERGAGLSVGQKQLIAFARALAFDPRILILDEATSSIDTETEQLIQQALERLLAGRTSVVIAHRLSTIQRADRILVMHKGEVREVGTHQELLALRGIYYRLYLLQYREQELERHAHEEHEQQEQQPAARYP